jgi:hypothetical protein
MATKKGEISRSEDSPAQDESGAIDYGPALQHRSEHWPVAEFCQSRGLLLNHVVGAARRLAALDLRLSQQAA